MFTSLNNNNTIFILHFFSFQQKSGRTTGWWAEMHIRRFNSWCTLKQVCFFTLYRKKQKYQSVVEHSQTSSIRRQGRFFITRRSSISCWLWSLMTSPCQSRGRSLLQFVPKTTKKTLDRQIQIWQSKHEKQAIHLSSVSLTEWNCANHNP